MYNMVYGCVLPIKVPILLSVMLETTLEVMKLVECVEVCEVSASRKYLVVH